MPDRDLEQQQSARLLTALIWIGVGLAPVAAIVVLLGGSDNSVRFAVLLIAVCVVMIGTSMLIRNDAVLVTTEIEDRVAAEVDTLRGELREEIAAAARATSHRVQTLQDEVSRLRAAGSPVAALPRTRPEPGQSPNRSSGNPAGARAAAARPAVATASTSVGPPAVGPPAVGSKPVGPPAVGSKPVGSASVGSASVGAVSVGAVSVGSASVGSASVAAAAIPLQRGAAVVPPPVVPPDVVSYQGEYGSRAPKPISVAAPRAVGDYGPGPSGSAWAERRAAADRSGGSRADRADDSVGSGSAERGPSVEQRPSRRHAAPDTGTDIARFGLGDRADQGYAAGTEIAPFGLGDRADRGYHAGTDIGRFGRDDGADQGYAAGPDIARFGPGGPVHQGVAAEPDVSSVGGPADLGYAAGIDYRLTGGYDQPEGSSSSGGNVYGYADPAAEDRTGAYLGDSDIAPTAGYVDNGSFVTFGSQVDDGGFDTSGRYGDGGFAPTGAGFAQDADGFAGAAGYAGTRSSVGTAAGGFAATGGFTPSDGYAEAGGYAGDNGYAQNNGSVQANGFAPLEGYDQAIDHASAADAYEQANGDGNGGWHPGGYGQADAGGHPGGYGKADGGGQAGGYGRTNGYGQGSGYAGRSDQYGPDPMAAQDNPWGHRTQDPYGRW